MADTNATAPRPTPPAPAAAQPKRSAPTLVREAKVASIYLRLKRWPDGQHSIELSQKTRMVDDRGKSIYHDLSVGEFEATGLCDAISALVSTARGSGEK